MNPIYDLALTEKELRALEVIFSCVDASKLTSTSNLALSMHHLKLSDIFLTLEKINEFIQENLKREDE